VWICYHPPRAAGLRICNPTGFMSTGASISLHIVSISRIPPHEIKPEDGIQYNSSIGSDSQHTHWSPALPSTLIVHSAFLSYSTLATTSLLYHILILIHSFEHLANMPTKYQPIQDDEKFSDVFIARRSSTSSSDSTLLCEDGTATSQERKGPHSRWLWLAHAVLLSLSTTMFAASYFRPVSTLEHVQHFSAYCKSLLSTVE
jgi:hypothetical protein